MEALTKRLPAIKQGTEKPATPAEAAELAGISCTQRQKDYALAVRLYTDAFAADPKLSIPTTIHRYNAACAAARLAAGDDPGTPVEAEEASRFRNQAREWLVAELVVIRRYAESGQDASRRWATDRFNEWLYDPDLVSVRDSQRLATLPTDERKAWEELWAQVVSLRKIADPLLVPPIGQ